MKSRTTSLVLLAIGLLHLPLMAENAREITWKDLVPAHELGLDPMRNLDYRERDLVDQVMRERENLPPRTPENEDYYRSLSDDEMLLEGLDIDIEVIEDYHDAIQAAVVEELDGQLIRLGGYCLPLEYSDEKVTEFLLVPYVGACIHVPPPPPNQIVHVQVDESEGFEPEGLFDPVWVTGKIEAQAMTEDLFLVDGSADVDISYALHAESVELHE